MVKKKMELGTAGSILSFAIDLESKAVEFYNRAIDEITTSSIKDTFENNKRQHHKILKTVERMRKENVTEMILEPIHDFKSDEYAFETNELSINISSAKKVEQNILEFLKVSAEKVTFLPEMKELLEDLADRVTKNIATLEKIGVD